MIIVTDRPCQVCRTSNLVRVTDGTLLCWFCDGGPSWPMCHPEPDPTPTRRRKALVFWALVLLSWMVPVLIAGLIIRWTG